MFCRAPGSERENIRTPERTVPAMNFVLIRSLIEALPVDLEWASPDFGFSRSSPKNETTFLNQNYHSDYKPEINENVLNETNGGPPLDK